MQLTMLTTFVWKIIINMFKKKSDLNRYYNIEPDNTLLTCGVVKLSRMKIFALTILFSFIIKLIFHKDRATTTRIRSSTMHVIIKKILDEIQYWIMKMTSQAINGMQADMNTEQETVPDWKKNPSGFIDGKPPGIIGTLIGDPPQIPR